MARTRRGAASKSVVSVDFTGVESGGRGAIPEGDYRFEVKEATRETSQAGNDMVKLTFAVSEAGPYKGRQQWMYCTLGAESLWKFRMVLEALGFEVPDGPMDVDLNELVGAELMGSVIHEDYQGEVRSRIAEVTSLEDAEEAEEDEEEEEAPKKTKGKASKKKAEPEDDEEDEEDEEPAPKAKAKAKKGKSKFEPVTAEAVQAMDEDELADLAEQAGLDFDPDDYSTVRKMRAAVIDLLEEADLIAEPDSDEEDEEEEEDDSPAAKRKARREARKARG
jgi:flagellar biosynthesis GTPase FlhF